MKHIIFKQFTAATVFTVLLCTATSPLHAKEGGVTLNEIIAIARENNGELKALREESGIGEAGRIKAGLYPNPVLELEGASGAVSGSTSENRLSVGISQEFLTGGKREKRLALADSELLGFGSRLKDAERLLLLEVKSGFHTLVLTENRIELALRYQELNSKLLRIATERLEAGDVAELDVNLARVEAARGEGRRIDAELELLPARKRLLTLMGRLSGENPEIATAWEPGQAPEDLAALKALALKHRPDLQAATAEMNRGTAELALAKAERLPNLTAGVAFIRENSVTTFGGIDERSSDNLIALRLSAPLPFFDRNQSALRGAEARKNSAGVRAAFTQQGIEREVEAAHARFVMADKALNIYAKEIMPQLTENLKLLQEAYTLGEVGILAVIEEQKKFIEVNEGYLLARYNKNTAFAKLEAALGVDLNEIYGGKQ